MFRIWWIPWNAHETYLVFIPRRILRKLETTHNPFLSLAVHFEQYADAALKLGIRLYISDQMYICNVEDNYAWYQAL